MKILKGIFYAILVIVILVFVVALFLPSQYRVERSAEINKPVGLVYGYVSDFNNFYEWNPWSALEPNHSYEVKGDSGTIGQTYLWEGEIIGSGQMEFTEFNKNDMIRSDITFLAPNEGIGVVDWEFEGDENTTKVTWSLTGNADYPVGRYFGLMMDGMLGPSFEEGMAKLKSKCEEIEVP